MLERSILLYSPIPRELVPESLAFGGLKQNGRVPLPLWPGQRQTNLLFVFDQPKRALGAWVISTILGLVRRRHEHVAHASDSADSTGMCRIDFDLAPQTRNP